MTRRFPIQRHPALAVTGSRILAVCLLSLLGMTAFHHSLTRAAEDPGSPKPGERPVMARATPAEARRQAEVLHETLHAVLQEIHQQYYREDEGLPLPSASLDRVFGYLKKQQEIEIRWLAVDAKAMNVDHAPRTEFEKEAVRVLTGGAAAHEQTEQGVYRRVGKIVLASECLKCHLPSRTSNKSRTAGLSIAIPVKTGE